jgi:hypothetical protein
VPQYIDVFGHVSVLACGAEYTDLRTGVWACACWGAPGVATLLGSDSGAVAVGCMA